MFWQSVVAGFSNLFDWRLLVGLAGVSFVAIAQSSISAALLVSSLKSMSQGRVRASWLFSTVSGHLAQAIAVSGFVLFCLPAIIGGGGFTPRPLIGHLLWLVLGNGFLAMLIVFLLSLVPFLGKIVSETPGLDVFLQGIFILRPIAHSLYYNIADGRTLPNSALPSFWHSLGYVVIGLILCQIGMHVCGIALFGVYEIANEIRKRRDPLGYMLDNRESDPTTSMEIIGGFAGTVIGLVPLLMYGQYISLSMQALL